MQSRKNRGFTLIEVLIVVVVLAILAATIIPKFSDSTRQAKSSNAQFNLHALRSQVELYRVHHNGTVPTLLNFSKQLTQKTKADGTVDNTSGEYGPYLQHIPLNPFNNDRTVVDAGGNPPSQVNSSGGGWLYDETSGNLWANEVNHLQY
jgi:type II secretion system protein G